MVGKILRSAAIRKGDGTQDIMLAARGKNLVAAPDLAIVGAGAGGLMAAAVAGESGLRCLLFERKHQPGRKLLMCANNRCNVTNDLPVDAMTAAYGPPVGDFLRVAMHHLSPADLRRWFARRGLPTCVHKDGKVFPQSEKSADVLRLFSEQLRKHGIPVVYNAPVETVVRADDGFLVATSAFSIQARNVLLATGGVSYPKTGSVGDGQRIAKTLGHKTTPFRPGLVGFEIAETWLAAGPRGAFPGTSVSIFAGGEMLGRTEGEIEFSPQGLRGPAMVDASRLIARRQHPTMHFLIDLQPRLSEDELALRIERRMQAVGGSLARALADWLVPAGIARRFAREVIGGDRPTPALVARQLKHWRLTPLRPRPLKEAMVTVGGVALEDVDPQTMQSRLVPGLFFCGEVLDIDGPTGGFNLHAAFATAHLAVDAIRRRAAGTAS